MSREDNQGPVAGDRRACEALELVILPKEKSIGNLSVRRALPHIRRRMVGPFIFVDQMGPVRLGPGQGLDVRPHPHIGLATVTYLFQGSLRHRDSAGNLQDIHPDALNPTP